MSEKAMETGLIRASRITFLQVRSELDVACSVCIALSPLIHCSSVELQLDDDEALLVNAAARSEEVDVSVHLAKMKKALLESSTILQQQPHQYCYREARVAPEAFSDRLAKVQVVSASTNSAMITDGVEHVSFAVLDSFSHDARMQSHRLDRILTLASSWGAERSLLILLDDGVYASSEHIIASHSGKLSCRLLVVRVPVFGPPSLDFHLTEAAIVTGRGGLDGLLPILCAGVSVGVLRTAPFYASDLLSLVPVDIALHIALYALSNMMRGSTPFNAASNSATLTVKSSEEITWSKLSQYILDYYTANYSDTSRLFQDFPLLTPSPSLEFFPSLPIPPSWGGSSLPSIPPLHQFRGLQRKKELLFQLPETISSPCVEKLIKATEALWTSLQGGQSEPSSSSLSFSSPFACMMTPAARPYTESEMMYMAMLRKAALSTHLLPHLSYISASFVDWKMYLQVIARSAILHLAKHYLLHCPSSVVLPTPTREFMNFSSMKGSSASQLRSVVGFMQKVGHSDMGKRLSFQPGISNERISSILVQPEVQRVMTQISVMEGTSNEVIRQRANKILQRIGDTLNVRDSRIIGSILYGFFSRTYNKVEINNGAYERLRAWNSLPKVQVVLVLLHRSYVDFMIMSVLLASMALPLPHVVAGEDFMQMGLVGDLMRGSGAFFMRRSFREDQLYATLFKEYVRNLVLNCQPTEFFIEGKRSRTGKTLQPKLGILKFISEAFLDEQKEVTDVLFIPISLSYDQLLETPVYAKELLGVPKPKETIFNMIKGVASMKQDYGSIHIHVGDAVSLQETQLESEQSQKNGNDTAPMTENLKKISPSPTSKTSRHLLQHLSSKLTRIMESNVVITSTAVVASALESLSIEPDKTPAISYTDLTERAMLIKKWVKERKAKISNELDVAEGEALTESGLHHLSSHIVREANTISFAHPENLSRIAVNINANQLAHLFLFEATLSVIGLAYGVTFESKSQKIIEMKREVALNSSNIIRYVLTQEFPSLGYISSSEALMEQAIARLSSDGESKEILSSIEAKKIEKNSIFIPCSCALFSFSSHILLPHLDAIYGVSITFMALCKAFPHSSFQLSHVVKSIHQAFVNLYDEKWILQAITCTLDPIWNHFESLVQLNIVEKLHIKGVLHCRAEDDDALQRLQVLSKQLHSLRWKSKNYEEEVETFSDAMLLAFSAYKEKSKM